MNSRKIRSEPYLKLPIKEILTSDKEVKDNFVYLILPITTSSRVRVIGKLTRIYEYKNRVELIVDDDTSEIVVKVWEDKLDLIKDINKGDIIEVFGVLRIYRDNIYISPEIIMKRDEKYLELRKIEYELIKKYLQKISNTNKSQTRL